MGVMEYGLKLVMLTTRTRTGTSTIEERNTRIVLLSVGFPVKIKGVLVVQPTEYVEEIRQKEPSCSTGTCSLLRVPGVASFCVYPNIRAILVAYHHAVQSYVKCTIKFSTEL
jgi:hypothetical protein